MTQMMNSSELTEEAPVRVNPSDFQATAILISHLDRALLKPWSPEYRDEIIADIRAWADTVDYIGYLFH